MTINDTLKEIKSITQKLIENGLSVQEKFPQKTGNKIAWEGQSDVSIALKNVSYEIKYETLESGRNYNFKMLDGALIQFMYEFNNTGRNIISHRLAFLPSPHLERYDDIPEDYENLLFGNSEFHDILEKNIVAFPIRFDFNLNPNFFVDVEHPYSHVTFGEYEFCRIPANSPITPCNFINFILRNFYNYAIRTKGEIIPLSTFRFNDSITNNEKKIIHFNIR